ncbi:Membrane-fusion protein [Rodentibacter pneumotropicus]|uniref:Membrane-fusion protein n=1 Tax=Rodentibacter pneumotropicus TaxID=758 RepID=A0A3S4TVD7_9PAST|nr:Membrane-fusion protein [Rodentibacter pneumotropicus]
MEFNLNEENFRYTRTLNRRRARLLFFVGNNNQQSTYLTEKVTRGNIEKTVVASGSISSINEVDVGAQVSGKITRLYVILGQEVKKGDLIADIDSTTQINALNTKKLPLPAIRHN